MNVFCFCKRFFWFEEHDACSGRPCHSISKGSFFCVTPTGFSDSTVVCVATIMPALWA
jgi:hypothetical protein